MLIKFVILFICRFKRMDLCLEMFEGRQDEHIKYANLLA